MSERHWWSSSSGKIELQIAFGDACTCNHPGPFGVHQFLTSMIYNGGNEDD